MWSVDVHFSERSVVNLTALRECNSVRQRVFEDHIHFVYQSSVTSVLSVAVIHRLTSH